MIDFCMKMIKKVAFLIKNRKIAKIAFAHKHWLKCSKGNISNTINKALDIDIFFGIEIGIREKNPLIVEVIEKPIFAYICCTVYDHLNMVRV